MTKPQKEIAERIAELLAQSFLDDHLKELIVDKIDLLPEGMIGDLLVALETENDQLDMMASKIEEYITEQESGWTDVQEKQKNYAEKFLEDAAQNLDDQARIQELKESI